MRLFALLVVLAFLPLAGADQTQGSSAGLNLGYVQPGLWDVYAFATPGGAVAITLTWSQPAVFPFADYDLRLYRPGALDDGYLGDDELVRHSSQNPYAHHGERIDITLAGGTYVVAVVPFQAQYETYTLTADPGSLTYQTTAIGYQAYSQ